MTPATGVKATQPLPMMARAGSPPAAAPAAPREDFNEQGELRVMKEMVARKEWGAAVTSLTKLVAHNSASKQYRVTLSYCRAKQADAAGRTADAIAEIQRALEIDPEFPLGKTMLAELRARRR
jgi:glutamine amidotransferase PdxT